MKAFVLLGLTFLDWTATVASSSSVVALADSHYKSPRGLARIPRGGAAEDVSTKAGKTTKKRKKKKKKKKDSSLGSDVAGKKAIEDAMKAKDAAQAMGDAIRERADQVMEEKLPFILSIDDMVHSVGLAMGSSSPPSASFLSSTAASPTTMADGGGGVEASPTSVLANYFLKSHGGAHALQSACSLFTVLACLGALLVPGPVTRIVLVKRAMLLTVTKHLSGMLAATTVTAQAIPEIGLRKARAWMEQLALDPVSQYVFYAALIMLWLPSPKTVVTTWWVTSMPKTAILLLLMGPVLLREFISTLFVASDVLLLLSSTKTASADDDEAVAAPFALRTGRLVVDTVMSLLVTPRVWRDPDSATRQEILAKLTSRVSLFTEALVGVLIAVDTIITSVWRVSQAWKRLLFCRLYLNYLWIRRKPIAKLAYSIRGGASKLPNYVLDVLLDPRAAMGLQKPDPATTRRTWINYVIMALGLDE